MPHSHTSLGAWLAQACDGLNDDAGRPGRFGAQNVGAGEIQTGDEGRVFPATVLFPSSAEDREQLQSAGSFPLPRWLGGFAVAASRRFMARSNRCTGVRWSSTSST